MAVARSRRPSLEVAAEQSPESQDERTLLLSFLKYPEDAVLDVGTGDCACVASLLAAQEIAVVASDADAETVGAAENFLRQKGLWQQVYLIQDDITASRLGSGSFLNIVCFNVLHHVPEWQKALAELDRILARGGRLLISDYDENSTGFVKELERAVRRRFALVAVHPRPQERLLFVCEKQPAGGDRIHQAFCER